MWTVVIQAGGESRRMGRDKGLLPFLGRPLVARLADRLGPLADELIVVTNRPDDYRFLGLPLAADDPPGRGPLGGLHTALQAAAHPVVAVVACDLPFASPALLAAQRDLLLEGVSDVVIPQGPNGLEPLHAVYRRRTCLPAVREALQQGAWKVIAWFEQVRVRILTEEEVALHEPAGLAFFNLNTQQDVRQAEALARKMEKESA